MEIAAAILLSYLIGSIPSSVWVGKLVKNVDIREHGSGNAGTTNTFRLLGWKAGSVVAIIDIIKGYSATGYVSLLAAGYYDQFAFLGWDGEVFIQVACGLIAVMGHMYPFLAGFRGGKGVITAAGMLLALEPLSVVVVLLIFALVLFTSRYVSLASIIAAGMYPFTLLAMKYYFEYDIDGSLLVISSLIALTIIVKHNANIVRLLQGTENRVRSFAPAKGWLNKSEPS